MPKVKSKAKAVEPLWKGPEEDGVTQSMLGRFLCCRERFRLHVIEGLRPNDQFSHRLEYGQMWHTCEEALASEVVAKEGAGLDVAESALHSYCRKLCARYPLSQEQIVHWYNVCRTQFPLYVAYWSKQPDVTARTPLLQEQVFDVPYRLPSGRTVRLRGKWDAVDLIGKGKDAGVYLFETKSKGDINEEQLRRQVGSGFDLQVMTYLVALQEYARNNSLRDQARAAGAGDSVPIKGVRYNVIRRPLSGGKGSIVRYKATKANPADESAESYYNRLSGIIAESPETYFMRWKVEITPGDVARFRRECLDPILEQLCEWYEYVSAYPERPWRNEWVRERGLPEGTEGVKQGISPLHWRHPYGIYNVLDEGGSSDLDSFMDTGNEVGLTRVTELFTELK